MFSVSKRTQQQKENKMITVDIAKDWIETLSNSQGFYGRMYRDLEDNNNWDKFVDILNNSNVVNMLDMVMLIEG